MHDKLIGLAAKQTAKYFLRKASLGFLSGPVTFIVSCILEYALKESVISLEMKLDGVEVNDQVDKYKEAKEKYIEGDSKNEEENEKELLDAFRKLSSL